MTETNKKSAAGSKSTSPESTEASPKKEPRMHVVQGRVAREVVRTYFDTRQGCVIDVIKIDKTVDNRKGDPVDITTFRKVYCRDEELQKKHSPSKENIEITEVEING